MYARLRWALACAVCLPGAVHPAFDPTDTVQIQANLGYSRDNNLFRLPDVDPRLFGINPENTSDTILIKGVGLKFDKLVSRQRIIADLNLNETTYDKNTNLDFFGGKGSLTWNWQIGNNWSGDASVRRERRLGGFSDFRQNVQDLIDSDTAIFTGRYRFHPRWTIEGQLVEQDTTHSAPERQTLDTNAHTGTVTVTYRTPAENSLGIKFQQTERTYPNRPTVGLVTVSNSHTETRLTGVAGWRFSASLQTNAELGHVALKHDTFGQRDFSGLTWRAGATWLPTAKLQFKLTGSKDLRIYEDLATSYVVVNAIGLSPAYSVTPKMVLQGDLTAEKRDYRGDPGFLITPVVREDNVRSARIALIYTPYRSLDFSLSYESGERTSTTSVNRYEYQTWFGSVRVSF